MIIFDGKGEDTPRLFCHNRAARPKLIMDYGGYRGAVHSRDNSLFGDFISVRVSVYFLNVSHARRSAVTDTSFARE